MNLTLISAPALEPVTLSEALAHLRDTSGGDDGLVESLTLAARQRIEEITGLALITQTWELGLDTFPCPSWDNPFAAINVPKVPLQSVTSITYTDPDGAAQTLAAEHYQVDVRSKPGRIIPAYGEIWPATLAVPNAAIVKFVGGYGDTEASVPEPLRQAVKIDLATLYEHREDVLTGLSVAPLDAVRRLIAPYRMWWI